MAGEIVASEGRSKADRNKRLFNAVLDGMSFKEAGKEFGVGPVRARSVFLREMRNAGAEIWDEGVKAGVGGAYASPSLKWARENKSRIVAAIESGGGKITSRELSERRVRRLMGAPSVNVASTPDPAELTGLRATRRDRNEGVRQVAER